MTVVGWRCIWVLNFISWIYHIFEIFSFLNPKAACPSLEFLLQQHLLPNNKSVFIFWVHQNKEPQTTWFQTTQSSHQFPQGWDLKSRCWRVVPSHRLTWGLLVQPGWLVVEFSFCRSELSCHFSSDQTVVSSSFSSYHTGSHIDPPAVPPGLAFPSGDASPKWTLSLSQSELTPDLDYIYRAYQWPH